MACTKLNEQFLLSPSIAINSANQRQLPFLSPNTVETCLQLQGKGWLGLSGEE
jgi:hypothetical protein